MLSKEETFKQVVHDFLTINIQSDPLPHVGIEGALYVRDNDTFNQGLIRHCEKKGAETITLPFLDAMNLLVEKHFQTQWEDARYIRLLRDKVDYNMLNVFSRKLNAIAQKILYDWSCGPGRDPVDYLLQTLSHDQTQGRNL